MENQLNKHSVRFNTFEDLEVYLAKQINNLNLDQEYSILAHQVNTSYDIFNNRKFCVPEILHTKLNSIFEYGFSISEYSTIYGTARLIGSSEENVVNKLLNYNYYINIDHRLICIIAIPKHIKVNGQNIEYSTYKNLSAINNIPELVAEYKKYSVLPEFHHFKCCLFDAIKGYRSLPKCYMLGAIEIDKENQTYVYYTSGTHLSTQSEQVKSLHQESIEKAINNLYAKNQTTSLKTIIVKSYLNEHAWREAQNELDV